MPLQLKNPHSVLGALETRPQDVLQVNCSERAGLTEAWKKVVETARKKGVKVQGHLPAGNPSRSAGEGGRETGAMATVRELPGVSAEELFSDARERGGGTGLWLALDSLQDPHNVGAIFRSAAFFGVQGILVTQERSAPLTPTVYDVASGGMEAVPFAFQTNLQRGFEVAKEAGLWILGASEHAHDELGAIQRDRPWLLVIGNEEKGMRRLTEEACDMLCRLPARGPVGSLNASVAAGIFIAYLTSGFSAR